MKIFSFKLGVILTILGVIWIGIIFDQTDKAHDSLTLEKLSSHELSTIFTGTGIGYYKIHVPEFAGQQFFIQILDTKDNVIREEKIQTKLSVGYFDYKNDGAHTIKVTNIFKDSMNLQIEFGATNSHKMTIPGIFIFVGVITMMITSFLKIKNYNIEQPDENIL